MNDHESRLTQLLRTAEQSTRPTPDERARAERAMWHAFEEHDGPVLAEDRAARPASPELVRVETTDGPGRRSVRWFRPALAAAAVLAVVVAGLVIVGDRDDATNTLDRPDDTSFDPTAEETVPTPDDEAVAPRRPIMTAGQIDPGSYQVGLGGVTIGFEITEPLVVTDLTDDSVTVGAPDRDTPGNDAELVTIFVGDPVVPAEDRRAVFDGLAAPGQTVQRVARIVDGTAAEDWLVAISDPSCDSLTACVPIARAPGGAELELMNGGSNRLTVVDRADDAVLVLATTTSQGSGDAIRIYQALAGSLTLSGG